MEFDSSLYKPIIVTVDGTAASGKGTIVKGLSRKLGDNYDTLDAGLMYRAFTFYQIKNNVSHRDLENTEGLLRTLEKEIQIELASKGRVKVNGELLSETDVRGPDIDPFVGKYARIDDVKFFLVNEQIKMVQNRGGKGLILDGRCMGTAVCPEAQAKFFVDAPSLVRATRRHQDYVKQGKTGYSTESIHIDLERRDEMDYTTNIAPLKKPSDAIAIDTFKFGPEEGVDHAFRYVQRMIEEEGKL